MLCLILLAPLLAWVAPNFGSRAIFLAALLGIVLVVLAQFRTMVFEAKSRKLRRLEGGNS